MDRAELIQALADEIDGVGESRAEAVMDVLEARGALAGEADPDRLAMIEDAAEEVRSNIRAGGATSSSDRARRDRALEALNDLLVLVKA